MAEPAAAADWLEQLHAPLERVLHGVLHGLRLPTAARVLDLGCGSGLKLPWLRQAAGVQAQLLGLDRERRLLQHARQNPVDGLICADAQFLPLQTASLDLVWCVALLNATAAPQQVLAEARRVLVSGGQVLLLTGELLWVRMTNWPETLAGQLAQAYTVHLASGQAPLAPGDDLGGSLRRELEQAGFSGVQLRAWLLDTTEPLCEIGLLDPALLAQLCGRPGLAQAARIGDAELRPVALLAHAAAATAGTSV